MATIINGKEVSAKVKEQVAEEVKQLKDKGIHPGLAVVIVGEDPASKTYVKNKKLACQAVGIHSEEYALPAETTQAKRKTRYRRYFGAVSFAKRSGRTIGD